MNQPEWHARYKSQLMAIAGIDSRLAESTLNASLADIDYTEIPEDVADAEISYLCE